MASQLRWTSKSVDLLKEPCGYWVVAEQLPSLVAWSILGGKKKDFEGRRDDRTLRQRR